MIKLKKKKELNKRFQLGGETIPFIIESKERATKNNVIESSLGETDHPCGLNLLLFLAGERKRKEIAAVCLWEEIEGVSEGFEGVNAILCDRNALKRFYQQKSQSQSAEISESPTTICMLNFKRSVL